MINGNLILPWQSNLDDYDDEKHDDDIWEHGKARGLSLVFSLIWSLPIITHLPPSIHISVKVKKFLPQNTTWSKVLIQPQSPQRYLAWNKYFIWHGTNIHLTWNKYSSVMKQTFIWHGTNIDLTWNKNFLQNNFKIETMNTITLLLLCYYENSKNLVKLPGRCNLVDHGRV